MDNVKGKMSGQTEERQLQQSSSDNAHKEEKRKVSRTWEAAMRLKPQRRKKEGQQDLGGRNAAEGKY